MGIEKQHGNNTFGCYSHAYAKKFYSKKKPKDLKEKVMGIISTKGIRFFSVEGVSRELEVLHKHVFQVFQELLKEGVITKNTNDYNAWKRSHDAWHVKSIEDKFYQNKNTNNGSSK